MEMPRLKQDGGTLPVIEGTLLGFRFYYSPNCPYLTLQLLGGFLIVLITKRVKIRADGKR